jgi:cardiolipin synthase
MYVEDLTNATEIVAGFGTRRQVVKNLRQARRLGRRQVRSHHGSVGRLAAGAIALSNTVGTAIAGSRSLTATEARSIATIGTLLLAVAAAITVFPALIVSPIVITLVWFGIALLIRASRLGRRVRARRQRLREHEAAADAQIQPGE